MFIKSFSMLMNMLFTIIWSINVLAATDLQLKRLGDSSNGNKLTLKLTDQYYAHQIRVLGTDDINEISDGSGAWTSGEKYTSLMQTLEFLIDGAVVAEYSFDADGDLTDVPNVAQISFFGIEDTGDESYLLSWDSLRENEISTFTVERSSNGGAFEEISEEVPEGEGSSYEIIDEPADIGVHVYKLKSVFNDGSVQDLGQVEVQLEIF